MTGLIAERPVSVLYDSITLRKYGVPPGGSVIRMEKNTYFLLTETEMAEGEKAFSRFVVLLVSSNSSSLLAQMNFKKLALISR